MPTLSTPTQRKRDKRLYNYRWHKASRSFRRMHQWCAECKRNGVYTNCHPGPEHWYTNPEKYKHERHETCGCVDHITPHDNNPERFWDSDNWQTLCDGRLGSPNCHDKKTKAGL